MGLAHSPRIVTNGLVFAYDMENTKKSWKGKPTTNLAKQSNGNIDWSIANLNQAVSRSTIVNNEKYLISSTSQTGDSFRMYFNLSNLVNGQTYTLSYRYRILSGSYFRATDWNDQSITRNTYSLSDGTYYETATGVRSTYDSTYRFMDFSISNNTQVEIWDLQLEQSTFASPYVNSPSSRERSNTQAILDLTGNNTVTATDLTYNADGTFDFGSGKYATIPNPITNGQPYTILMVAKPDSLSTAAYNSSSGRSTILRGDGHWNPGIWMTQNTIRSHCTTEYRDTNINWSDLRTSMVGMTFDGTNCFNVFDGKIQTGTRTSYAPGTPSTIVIGNDVLAGTTFPWDGKIYMMMYYNRALSAEEVQQNFNAVRSRYSI